MLTGAGRVDSIGKGPLFYRLSPLLLLLLFFDGEPLFAGEGSLLLLLSRRFRAPVPAGKERKEGRKNLVKGSKGVKAREGGERESKGTPVALKTCIQGRGNRLTGGLPKELFYVASKCFASTFAAHSRRRGDPAPLKERGGKRERNCKPRKFFRFFPTKKGGKTNFSSPLFRKKGEHGKVFPRAFYSLPRSVVWERGKGVAKKFPLPPLFYTGSPSVRPS